MSLRRSLDRGRNSTTIQWDTIRGVCLTLLNFIHSSPGGTGGAMMTDGKKTTFVTRSSTNTLWYKRFIDGSHERMGNVKLQDVAISIDVLLKLQRLLEASWVEARQSEDRHLMFEAATLGCVITCGFSSGLRGEELSHVRLQESLILTIQGLQQPHRKHVVLALEGRFKGQVAWKKHKIPLECKTRSGIQHLTWLTRLFEQYKLHQEVFGPLFRQKPGDQRAASVRTLDILFHKYLLLVQDVKNELILEDADVLNRHSVQRLLRQGSTMQARNVKVPHDVINLNNRWRTEEAARHHSATGSEMLEVYTDSLAAIESLLQYSKPL
ncbi:hypothetical protein ACA910_014859 [Epithemia clementina (nom. ined.)]